MRSHHHRPQRGERREWHSWRWRLRSVLSLCAVVVILASISAHALKHKFALNKVSHKTSSKTKGIVCLAEQVGKPCHEVYPCNLDCLGKKWRVTCYKNGVCTAPGDGTKCSWG